MKTLLRLWLCFAVALGAGLSGARAAIGWRVSVNIILDSDGNWPSPTNGFTGFSSSDAIRAEFDRYNEMLGQMCWGYRLELVEVKELTKLGSWFDRDSRDGPTRIELEVKAKNPLAQADYNYRADAMNVYINNSSSGISGGSPYIPLVGDVIMVGVNGYWPLIVHELGHCFGLDHTHGPCNDAVDCGYRWGNNDGCDDTIDDYPEESLDHIAMQNFHTTYARLTVSEREQVDNVWHNIMSYHSNQTITDRFTHDQWEKMVDAANDLARRRSAVTGTTWFVDDANEWGLLDPPDLPRELKDFMNTYGHDLAWFVDNHYLPNNWGTRDSHWETLSITIPEQQKEICADGPKALNPDSGKWQYLIVLPDLSTRWSDDLCITLTLPAQTITFPVFKFGGPWKTLAQALAFPLLNRGDRLQIKAGYYNEKVTIRQPMTLATDRGSVFIGKAQP